MFWILQDTTEPDRLDKIKKLIEIAASSLTLVAVVIGAVWTYWLFVRTRQRYPSANLTQKVDYRILAEGKLWLRVTVTLQNVSKVLLSLVYGKTWIQQVKPVDSDLLSKVKQDEEPLDEDGLEYLWPLAVNMKEKDWPKGTRQIEPGESDQVHFDFILNPEIETIIVYSYFRNAKRFRRKKELGWQITNVFDVKSVENGGKTNGSDKNGAITAQANTTAATAKAADGRNEASTSETDAARQEVRIKANTQEDPNWVGGDDEATERSEEPLSENGVSAEIDKSSSTAQETTSN